MMLLYMYITLHEHFILYALQEDSLLHVLPVWVKELHHLTDLTLTGSTHSQCITTIRNIPRGKMINPNLKIYYDIHIISSPYISQTLA